MICTRIVLYIRMHINSINSLQFSSDSYINLCPDIIPNINSFECANGIITIPQCSPCALFSVCLYVWVCVCCTLISCAHSYVLIWLYDFICVHIFCRLFWRFILKSFIVSYVRRCAAAAIKATIFIQSVEDAEIIKIFYMLPQCTSSQPPQLLEMHTYITDTRIVRLQNTSRWIWRIRMWAWSQSDTDLGAYCGIKVKYMLYY